MKWLDGVSPGAKVIALTGNRDVTTAPELEQAYVESLKARGVHAVFQLVSGAGHVDVLRSPAIADATFRLLRR